MPKLKILIVEDEVLIAMQLATELRRMSYEVCPFVTSGEKAVESVIKEQPDLVLIDIRLAGEMDGIEAATEITTHSKARIIFMTGFSDEGLKNRAMAVNPVAYLNKPVDVRQIEAVMTLASDNR